MPDQGEMSMNQKQAPLFEALLDYAREKPAYFRIPGHRFDRGIPEDLLAWGGPGLFRLDVTEAPPLDDLHSPRGVIREAETLAARAFGADRTFFLVNGSTCGNQAMILASAGEGEPVLIARNAHKSVMAGLILSGADPVYLAPSYLEFPGIQGGLEPGEVRRILETRPGIRGIFTVSPTYHGLCGELPALASLAGERGIPLLVDEAHGAHFYFHPELPDGALTLGAHGAVQSLHKTGGALTQSSLLHLKGDRLDPVRVDRALRLTQSTSPSYLLMASLDTARKDLALRGRERGDRALELADTLRRAAEKIPGIRCPGRELTGSGGVRQMDLTRVLVNLDGTALEGFAARERLYREFGVDVELADSRNLTLVVTWGNTEEEIRRFVKGLGALVREAGPAAKGGRGRAGLGTKGKAGGLPEIPPRVLTPRQAWFRADRTVPWREARGCVAGEMAAPYPPGIPVLYPGEVITPEIWDFLEECRRERRHLHGPADRTLETFRILPE